ncbi:MAG: hypothetical protein LDL23_04140 [Flavobacterium sp.]|uniref:hypothetical protein n=1 Tax=Flavobacterium sp. TaxID=239 RepID=UPI0025C52317|nr:hypothetical protein [Flavobacterium sp.]MCA1965822.1 hypothetical protein [Flavobacterium sp.]
MELERIVEDIKDFCDKENIVFFNAENLDLKSDIIEFELGLSHRDFLIILKKLNIKILIIQTELNEINLLINNVEDKNIIKYDDDIRNLKLHNNEISLISLYFKFEGVYYLLKLESDWNQIYENFISQLSDSISDSYIESLEEVKNNDKGIVNKIITFLESDSNYHNLKRKELRFSYIEKYLENEKFPKEFVLKNKGLILRESEVLYNTIIKDKIDKELGVRIKELKKEGMKRGSIVSELGISYGTVNKFYFKD